MNEVSIIINGVRYDAVKSDETHSCKGCELTEWCTIVKAMRLCTANTIFKKSPKSFER